jgi:hypothetical protein
MDFKLTVMCLGISANYKTVRSGELYVMNSINHRYFEHELVPLADETNVSVYLPCFD